MIEGKMVSIDRLFKILEIPQELEQTETQATNWPHQGKLEFQDVFLKYRPTTDMVLKGLNFKINPKEKIGIVGRTGAGKSTICLSISRIVELFSGKILIDNIEIGKLNLDYLRQRITVIPQDPVLFNGTLRFNLDPFNEVADSEILRLLEEAGLEEIIKRGGLALEISEGGSNLSSGEK